MNANYHPITNQRSAPPISQLVQQAALRSGINFDYLMDVARVESNFNPTAKASTSSATGLYQFTSQTWLSTIDRHGASMGLDWAADAISRDSQGRYSVKDSDLRAQILALRNDPATASAMAAAFTADNRSYIEPRIGRSAESVDLYLAHFLGSQGAVNFLSAMSADPNQAAAPLMPEAAAANRNIFYNGAGQMRSLFDIRELFRAKLEHDPASMTGASSPYAPSSMPPLSPSFAPKGWEISSSSTSQAVGSGGSAGRPPLQLMEIKPMPKKLSMGFAADAYRRLASLNGGKA